MNYSPITYKNWFWLQTVLGKTIQRPAKLDKRLARELKALADPEDPYDTVTGKTMCTYDFYEGSCIVITIFYSPITLLIPLYVQFSPLLRVKGQPLHLWILWSCMCPRVALFASGDPSARLCLLSPFIRQFYPCGDELWTKVLSAHLFAGVSYEQSKAHNSDNVLANRRKIVNISKVLSLYSIQSNFHK